MTEGVPAPGKAELDRAGWCVTAHLSDAAKIKRAASNKLDTNVQHAAAGLIYTTTAITITKVVVYATTTIASGNLAVDVGINGDDNALVSGAAISNVANDSVTDLTIAGASVAAGKMVTATVKTASGDASQTFLVAIEYNEAE